MEETGPEDLQIISVSRGATSQGRRRIAWPPGAQGRASQRNEEGLLCRGLAPLSRDVPASVVRSSLAAGLAFPRSAGATRRRYSEVVASPKLRRRRVGPPSQAQSFESVAISSDDEPSRPATASGAVGGRASRASAQVEPPPASTPPTSSFSDWTDARFDRFQQLMTWLVTHAAQGNQGSGGVATARAAPQAALDMLPVEKMASTAGEQCAICHEPMACGEDCRRLPCLHLFHAACIDRWLRVSSTCPLDNLKVEEMLARREGTGGQTA